jgi:hypothetical protein
LVPAQGSFTLRYMGNAGAGERGEGATVAGGPAPSSPALVQRLRHALALHRQGRLAEVEAAYRDILRDAPGQFDAPDNGRNDGSDIRRRIEASVHEVINISGLDDRQAASLSVSGRSTFC